MIQVMTTAMLPCKAELQMLLLRLPSDVKHNEHRPTSWKMNAHYPRFPFNLWSNPKFRYRKVRWV